MLPELLHDADMKVFRRLLHSTHCIHQLFPHWNLCQWNSALLIALLVFPTAIITSTNIHLFYDVFLMEHINCLCCCLACYSLLLIFRVFPLLFLIYFLCFLFLLGNAVLQLHTNVSLSLLYCCYRYCVSLCNVSPSVGLRGGDMDLTGRRPEDSGSLSHEMPATDLRYSLDRPHQQRDCLITYRSRVSWPANC